MCVSKKEIKMGTRSGPSKDDPVPGFWYISEKHIFFQLLDPSTTIHYPLSIRKYKIYLEP